MANRIVSWSGDEHRDIVSPNLSKRPVTSFDSIFSDKSEVFPGDRGPRMVELHPTHTASQAIEPNGTRTLTSTTMYPETDAANHDGSFMRHEKYFFKDGNISFLVRDIQPSERYAIRFIL